ncbi:dihydrodipicolinate reductase [Thioalkalivibrio denitrificans]|uniref:Dihydrodipicolinate reductase n=1 Tax=Thioalkalivibrio denitrificans TaxID=108003 RepID=A0A1V3NNA2_9GAMM|nr:2,4-diaminopentanoate dehydrogenase [Thioalkalivibrio denitrificans]OOG26433.1 dihydrodipicolinate reductase [Thioalkalivibrio denitrificans]
MRDAIPVLVLGTGQMGCGIARLVLEKPGLALAGAWDRRAELHGLDLGRVIGIERDLGITVGADLAFVIAECRPRVAIQATCSRLDEAAPQILTLLQHGVHVISIAEEMACPHHSSPKLAREMDVLARSRGVAVAGTGINPGFVLDRLIITLTGVCADIRSITARRVNDLSPYGPSVMAAQGVGLSPEAFREGVADGSVVGHVGFPESIHLIADAVGWEVERIEERREPIIARVRRETPRITVEPGQAAGCLHTAVAYRDGEAVINLIHPQQVLPSAEGIETGDSIEIRGTPDVRLSGSPEIPGGTGTMALAVNTIPVILTAPPGLHTLTDLPAPAAMLGGARGLHTEGHP